MILYILTYLLVIRRDSYAMKNLFNSTDKDDLYNCWSSMISSASENISYNGVNEFSLEYILLKERNHKP